MARRPTTPGSKKRTSLAAAAKKAAKRPRRAAVAPVNDDDTEDSGEEAYSADDSDSQDNDDGSSDDASTRKQPLAEDGDVTPATEIGTSMVADKLDEGDFVPPPDVPVDGKLTKNEFMSKHIRLTATTKTFRGIKFLTAGLIDSTMTKLAQMYRIGPESYVAWKNCYQKEVIYSIQNKRNSILQDVRPKMRRKYAPNSVINTCINTNGSFLLYHRNSTGQSDMDTRRFYRRTLFT